MTSQRFIYTTLLTSLLLSGSITFTMKSAVIGPLVTTHFCESYPYNQFCPDRTMAGSAAVAMAQAMTISKFPMKPMGQTEYLTSNNKLISIDFDSVTTYNWNEICAQQADKAEAARLIWHSGAAAHANYANDYTIVESAEDIVRAMKQNFGYSDSVRAIAHADSAERWHAILLDELMASRPIIYTASDSKKNYTHTFIIDGYDDTTDRWHVNFGQNGVDDGWMSLQGLAMQSMDVVLNSGHKAIIGIKPSGQKIWCITLSTTIIPADLQPADTAAVVRVTGPAGEIECDLALKSHSGPFELRGKILTVKRQLTDNDFGKTFPIEIAATKDGETLRASFSILVKLPSKRIDRATSLSYDREKRQFTITTLPDATFSLTGPAGEGLKSGKADADGQFTIDRNIMRGGCNRLYIASTDDASLTIELIN